MRILLDACVLFPTVMREVLLGVAARGVFTPLWSERILEEWARATVKLGDGAEGVARGEIALLKAAWPDALVEGAADVVGALPDPGDDHVLGAAIAGSADRIMTVNTRDFPLRVLERHGVGRSDPDGFLVALDASLLSDVVGDVQKRAEAASGRSQPVRALMKRAGMPRVGKRLAG